MNITEIYKLIREFYSVSHCEDIDDYLVSKIPENGELFIGNRFSERESLLIRQSENGLELALFLAPEVRSAIESGDLFERLNEFSCAVEGVSHFLYVIDRFFKSQQVSKLELELQAEVDKFIVTHLLMSRDTCEIPPSLFLRLFEDHSFNPDLSGEELARYVTASRYAAKFCAYLRTTYFNPLRMAGLRTKARDFFQRNLSQKISLLTP